MNIKMNLIIIIAVISFSKLYAAESADLRVTFKNNSDQALKYLWASSTNQLLGGGATQLYGKTYFTPGQTETVTLKTINSSAGYRLRFVAENPLQFQGRSVLELVSDRLKQILDQKHITVEYSPAYTLKEIKDAVERKQEVAHGIAAVPSVKIESKESVEGAVVPGIPGGVQTREELQLELKKAYARINALVDENRLLRIEVGALRARS